ncbi:MAG: dihydroneopterin aldolase [Candidatus Thalassarchaeaceae archaeon]|nr:dihydroneopterin aldolase [Candidatus Thalassarchaeaceae archaeon]MDP6702948.1 dihydroneopterin aldolase [Candidatus Thalassarchaeaceae archaeon]MDP7004275.1 dihydroneopterin aldolase [Candidatus Thalassarchaeaceae archaeon]
MDALSSALSESSGDVTIIFLEDAVREIEVGIHDFEHDTRQSVRFDIYAVQSESQTPEDDDIAHVLDYEYLQTALDSVISRGRFGLLESLASELLDEILTPPMVMAASVKITKQDIPDFEGELGCSVTRLK